MGASFSGAKNTIGGSLVCEEVSRDSRPLEKGLSRPTAEMSADCGSGSQQTSLARGAAGLFHPPQHMHLAAELDPQRVSYGVGARKCKTRPATGLLAVCCPQPLGTFQRKAQSLLPRITRTEVASPMHLETPRRAKTKLLTLECQACAC